MGRIAKAILDPKFLSNIPKAWHSDTIQRRVKNGGSPEARYLFEQTRLKPSIMLRMGRASMMPIQLTDAGLTSLSSAVVFTDSYNQAIKAGHNEAEATAIAADDMDDAVYRYSQPTGIGSRSLQELTGGQWKKAFMLFMSDARLKTALYFEAGTNIVKGKGTALDWQRVIFVHAMALISQIVLNAYRDTFSDDDDDEIWTAESLVESRPARAAPGTGPPRERRRRGRLQDDRRTILRAEPRPDARCHRQWRARPPESRPGVELGRPPGDAQGVERDRPRHRRASRPGRAGRHHQLPQADLRPLGKPRREEE